LTLCRVGLAACLVLATGAAAATEVALQRVAAGDIGVLLRIDGTAQGRPLRWLIDSGATHNLVGAGVPAAAVAGAARVPLNTAAGRIDGVPVELAALQVGGVDVPELPALQLDLAPLLGPLAREFDGVLGLPFLDRRTVHLDLQNDRLDLDARAPGAGAAVQRMQRLPVIEVQVQGRPHLLMLDTGAAGGIVRLARWFGAPGLALAPEVVVAGTLRRQVPVADLPGTALGRALPAGVAGSVGLATLDGCRLTLDLAGDRLAVHGCAADTLPGGFGFAWQVQDGALRIVQVLAGSPAQAAGLEAGDRVHSIDGRPAPADAAAADAALPRRGELQLEVDRAGAARRVTLQRAYFLPALAR
jgi:predicted aspartyl protease